LSEPFNLFDIESDLKRKLSNPDDYEIIDLIGKEVPEKFKLKGE
jgi:hypothetical protein